MKRHRFKTLRPTLPVLTKWLFCVLGKSSTPCYNGPLHMLGFIPGSFVCFCFCCLCGQKTACIAQPRATTTTAKIFGSGILIVPNALNLSLRNQSWTSFTSSNIKVQTAHRVSWHGLYSAGHRGSIYRQGETLRAPQQGIWERELPSSGTATFCTTTYLAILISL
jgi:hypothetical protein